MPIQQPSLVPQPLAARMHALWLQVLDLGVAGALDPQPVRVEHPRQGSCFISLP